MSTRSDEMEDETEAVDVGFRAHDVARGLAERVECCVGMFETLDGEDFGAIVGGGACCACAGGSGLRHAEVGEDDVRDSASLFAAMGWAAQEDIIGFNVAVDNGVMLVLAVECVLFRPLVEAETVVQVG